MSRCASLLGASASVVALALVVAGCGNSRAILYKGISPGVSGHRIVISDARAVRDGKEIRKQWLADIARAGREYPKQRFDNLPESRFRARLDAAATRDEFTVKRVAFLQSRVLRSPGRAGVPFIIVSSVKRGPNPHGGEWARSEELYPAPHG